MSQFLDNSKRCKNCSKFDLLSSTCNYCNHNFCKDHILDHTCRDRDEMLEQNRLPRCPMCQNIVTVKDGMTIDQAVSLHIDSGCRKKKSKFKKCYVCDKKRLIRCKDCGKFFCLHHRHQDAHDCPKISQTSVKKSINPILANVNRRANNFMSSISGNTDYSKSGKSIRNVFQNSKADPDGPKDTELHDRFYVDIFFPVNSNRKPKHMFFPKRWPLGKILDYVLKKENIHNPNGDIFSSDQEHLQLNLFSLTTGEVLAKNLTLGKHEERNTLSNKNSGMIIEYGNNIDEKKKTQLQELFKNGKSANCLVS